MKHSPALDHTQHVRRMVEALNLHDPNITRGVVDATCNAAANAHPEIERDFIGIRDECRAILKDRATADILASLPRVPRCPPDTDFGSFGALS